MLLLLVAGVALDRIFGEPRRWHPLVGFGWLAARIELALNRKPAGLSACAAGNSARTAGLGACAAGTFALVVAVLPLVALAIWLTSLQPWIGWCVHALALYAALGANSLAQHITPIAAALANHQLDAARTLTARIVSRDTAALDETGIARAAVESALENGNDAVFGALFWFILAGAPGAVLYRLANTLDAMWGYRNARFNHFGWAAARFDDLLNLAPARLTALTYALLGRTANALTCWRDQAAAWSSPNAGPVMAAGAGALGVVLGGPAMYAGEIEQRPPLGKGDAPAARHITDALRLVERGVIAWIIAFALITAAWSVAHA